MKGVLRRTRFVLLLVVSCLIMIFGTTATTYAKTRKPAKVKISSVSQYTSSSIKINWKKSKYARKYQVYVSIAGGKYKKVTTTKGKSFIHGGLQPGKTYSYKIRGINGSKRGAFSKPKGVYLPISNDGAKGTVNPDSISEQNEAISIGTESPHASASVINNVITLKWNSVSNASGYLIYRKEASGYVLAQDVTNLIAKISETELNTSYQYRVTPYRNQGGKRIYGTSSDVTATTGKSAYLHKIVTPYMTPYWYRYYDTDSFRMGGKDYRNGFTSMGYGSNGNNTYFNLEGKYVSLSFVSGFVDGSNQRNATVNIYKDGVLYTSYTIEPTQMPKSHTLDVTGCHQLRFCVDSNRSVADGDGTYGFADMIISKERLDAYEEVSRVENPSGSSKYLMDSIKPYSKPYNYHDYTSSVFYMGGKPYSHGFDCMGYGNNGQEVYFNLGGEYRRLSFISGFCQNNSYERNATVYIIVDGELALSYEIKSNELPKSYSVNVENGIQLLIRVKTGRSVADGDSFFGFGNIVITK